MSELLTCISKRISYVLSSKFPGTVQVINAAIRLIGEEPESVITTNPQLYIRVVSEFSNLPMILIISFPGENWVYEFLNAVQSNKEVDLIKILLRNGNRIIRYCDSQSADASNMRISMAEEVLSRNT